MGVYFTLYAIKLVKIMPKPILILIALMLVAGCTTTKLYAPPETVNGLRDQYAQFNRISAITHNILVANVSLCSKTKMDYGFTSMSVNGEGSEDQKDRWVKAFNLHEQPTVTYVIPKSAADRAGLRTDDAIISANDNLWSDVQSPGAFTKLLTKARQSPHLHLGVLRDGKMKTLDLTAEQACDYSFTMSLTNEHLAWAQNKRIVVSLGAAKLLKRDDELAFFISHELAHNLLGHTLPERKKELGDDKMRRILEEDADALGIRLMVRSGYDPEGAETAIRHTDLIDSGPITRLFNYHGPYMPIDKRILYLRKVLGE